MFKNNKTTTVIVSILFVLILAVSVVFGGFLRRGELPTDSSSRAEESREDSIADSSDSSETSSSSEMPTPEYVLPSVKTDTTAIERNIAGEMRAVYLKAGTDFAKSAGETEIRLRADIDTAIRSAKDLSLNTILFDTVLDGKSVMFTSTLLPMYADGFDPLDYAIKKAREYDMHIFAVVSPFLGVQGDTLSSVPSASPSALESVRRQFTALAVNYKLDGVVIDDYYYTDYADAYEDYLKNGNGMGFEEYKFYAVESCVLIAAKTLRETNNDLLVTLYADGIWKNASSDSEGSKTSGSFEAYYDGFADTKKMAESGCFDAVMIEAFGSLTAGSIPFEPMVAWWNEILKSDELPLYVMQASSKACTTATGWSSPDQLIKQIVAAKKYSTFHGSCFNSLSALQNDPKGSTTALIQYFGDEKSDDLILKDLVISKPAKLQFTTAEPLVQFSGASAPLFDLLLNGSKIGTDANGMFSMELELNPGTNTFKFEHKGKTLTYEIVREVEVIKDVNPIGTVSVEGGDRITVSVWAYNGSTVSATLNGKTITLTVDETATDSTDLESNYRLYTGDFTAPDPKDSTQNLGAVMFAATWDSLSETRKGATVTVNKRAQIGSGALIEVTADAAETFPTGVLNDYSDPDYFPLPKGTVDRILGEEITYVEDGKTYKYYKLESGVRVYSKDIRFISDTTLSNNKITGLKVTANDTKTKVILNTAWKVPFVARYDGSKITFKFSYTTTTPASLKLTKNPLFSSAEWSGSTLTLRLQSPECFMGFKSYYDGNSLVLEFNNPILMQSSSNSYGYTLKGTRIALDSGHGGGKNPGAVGVHPSYPEATINQAITKYLKEEFESLGATVYLIDSITVDPSLESRVQQAKNFNAHLLISIHQNSALSSKATGSEAFYFNRYSQKLAKQIASRLYRAVSTNNRGGKFGYYYLTRDTQFPGTLVECGFISNAEEHYKLIQSETQQAIAQAIVESVIAFGRETGGSSSFATGTESVGTTTPSGEDNNSSSSSSSGTSSSETSSNPSSSGSSRPGESSDTSSEIDPEAPALLTPREVTLKFGKDSIEDRVRFRLGSGEKRIAFFDVQVNLADPSDGVTVVSCDFVNGEGVVQLRFSKKGTYVIKLVGYDEKQNQIFLQNVFYEVT